MKTISVMRAYKGDDNSGVPSIVGSRVCPIPIQDELFQRDAEAIYEWLTDEIPSGTADRLFRRIREQRAGDFG